MSKRALIKILALILVAAPTATLQADLVGWWAFDDDVEDQSEYENHGLHDFPLFEDDVPDAIGEGTSLSFDGNVGVEIAADPSLDSVAFTLSMFILNRGQAAGFSRLTSRQSDTFETSLGTGGGGDQLKYYSPANGWNTTIHEVPFETWQHVAYVSDGLELSVYADGELVHGPVPITASPSGFFQIGNRWNNIEGFIGLLDDVALFDQPLDIDQIETIADAGIKNFLESFDPGDAPPARPSGLVATTGDGIVSLDWADVENVDGYNVYRADIPGGPYDKLNQNLVTLSEFQDTDVQNDIPYYYVVTSARGAEESLNSSEIAAIPRAPIENPLETLVAWWTFDDELTDRSGNQNHGTMNDPDFVDNVPDAIGGGKALRFDGSAGVAIAADPSLDSEVFTLAMFVFNHGQGLPFSRLASRGSDTFEASLGTGGGGDQLKYYSPANGWNATIHEVPFETWQHVAYVATGTDLTIYADGEVVHGPVPLTAAPFGILHIGDRWNNVEGVVATIDDVALFDVALSAEHIATIADVGVSEFLGNPPPAEGPPARPGGLLTESGDGQVRLEWDEVAEVSGYNLYRSDVSGGPYEKLNPDLLTTPGYLDTDVINNTRYYYVVTAVNDVGESKGSAEVAALPRTPVDDVEDALVAWWTFDETLDDETGLGHDGFLEFPVYDDNVPDAIGDGFSLSLDGSMGVEIAPAFDLDSEIFTLSMFVFNRGQIAEFSRTTSRGNDSFESAIGTDGGGDQLKYFSRAEGAWNATPHLVPFETWQHIAFVSDGAELTVYADGDLVHGPVPLTTTPSGVLHIGNRWNNIEGFIGSMDDVALFNEPLTQDQIIVISEDGVAGLLDPGTEPEEGIFIRGDNNADGSLNITDAVFVLEWLFGGGTEPSCKDAADANDDSGVNIADAVFLLDWLFGGGSELPPPTPPGSSFDREDCGPDPTDDPLDCARFAPCD